MKKKLFLSIIVFASLFILTGCNKENKTLKSILSKLTESESYKTYKDYGIYTESIKGNVLSISVKNDYVDATYDYKLKGDFLTLETTKDDMYGVILFSELASAIAENYGMDKESMSAYLNGVITDNLESDYVKYKDENGKQTYSIYAVGKFDMSLLDKMNITEKDLATFDKKPEGNGSGYGTKGNYIYYLTYSDGKYDSIIFAERKGFSENAYNNLLTLVKYFFEKDYKDFVANYPKLEEKSFGKFNIKYLAADNEDVIDHFSMKTENYKFIKISHN